MMAIGTTSSITASVNGNIFNPNGTRLPNKPRTSSAHAMSVVVGTAQLLIATGYDQLSRTKMIAGALIPPITPRPGRTIRPGEDSLSACNSYLTSRAIRKKDPHETVVDPDCRQLGYQEVPDLNRDGGVE